MAPIPVHIDDPIAPQKAQGVTSQTADNGAVPDATPASNPATTTTAAAAPPPSFPQAQPGQVVGPAPTPYAPNPQPPPTRTTNLQQDGPPPPQPGAAPIPPSSSQPSSLPPPPKAGESAAQSQTGQGTAFTGALDQLHMPPPQQNFAPTRSTDPATSMTPQHGGGPTTLNLGPVAGQAPASEHPPGYQQNIYAQELTPAQRASLEQEAGREGFAAQLGVGERTGGGIGGDGVGEGVGDVWKTAKSWLGAAGSKLAETEEEVWRRINGR